MLCVQSLRDRLVQTNAEGVDGKVGAGAAIVNADHHLFDFSCDGIRLFVLLSLWRSNGLFVDPFKVQLILIIVVALHQFD